MTPPFETQMINLIRQIGEPVSIFYEPRNEGMEWMVGLERTPMIHEHFTTINEGLFWLAQNKERFAEWRERLEEIDGTTTP